MDQRNHDDPCPVCAGVLADIWHRCRDCGATVCPQTAHSIKVGSIARIPLHRALCDTCYAKQQLKEVQP